MVFSIHSVAGCADVYVVVYADYDNVCVVVLVTFVAVFVAVFVASWEHVVCV